MPIRANRSTAPSGAPPTAEPDAPSGSSHATAWAWCAVAIAVLAFVARAMPMLRGGGLVSADGYDDSVYYAAATSLVHGRGPYDDFLLLHPPGLILALTPFAVLARFTSDTVGQDAARVSFMVLGAVNTLLVMRVGRRFKAWAGLGAGLVYALGYPAVYAERTTTLEALGTTTMLVALVLLLGPRAAEAVGGIGSLSRTRLALAGAALGAGAGVKIWGVVPLVVLAVWVLVVGGRRAAARVTGFALLSVTAICLPFFLHAPGQMWRYVVLDQLGRPRVDMTLASRLRQMTGLYLDLPHVPAGARPSVLALALIVIAAAAVVAMRTPGARILVLLLLAQAGVLLESPSFFLHYATITAAPAALLLGIGAQQVGEWLAARGAGRPVGWAAGLAATAVVLAWALPGIAHPVGKAFPPQLTAAAARTPGCITADDPTYLIEMNVLSRDLDHGCRVWVDVTGVTYDPTGGVPPGQPIDRRVDLVWQHKVLSYLLSGSGTVVARPETRLNRSSTRAVERLPVVARADGFALRQVG